MSTTFYVVMQKRRDGKVYADLHKTDGSFFLDKDEANRVRESDPIYREHFHVVELVAMTVDDWNELMKEANGGKT